MELDWTTFSLELINFLILLWLLKRVLYKPVLNAIAQRKADVQATVAGAERLRGEAQTLKAQYEHRLADWEHEKERARAGMLQDVAAERTRLLAEVRSSLDQEREKVRVLDEGRLEERARHVEEAAFAQAGQFAAALLSRFAGSELDARLVGLVLEDLPALSEEQRRAIRAGCSETVVPVQVTSARPLAQTQRYALTEALQKLLGRTVSCEWGQDALLLAGVRISVGPWVLRANLQDELRFFTEAGHRGSPPSAS